MSPACNEIHATDFLLTFLGFILCSMSSWTIDFIFNNYERSTYAAQC